MAKTSLVYDILISCPGDVIEDLPTIKDSITAFNETMGIDKSIVFRPKHWSTSSYPQSGVSGQQALNEQFVHDCDAAIAIFWNRFGTKTDEYGSGTEEEIDIMLQQGKQVFLYFCDKTINLSKIDIKQKEKIDKFKDKFEKEHRGLYKTYSSTEQLRSMLKDDFEKWIISKEKQIFPVQNRIILQCIDKNNKISPEIIKTDFTSQFDLPKIMKRINELYDHVPTLKVGKDYEPGSIHATVQLFSSLKIDKKIEEKIIKFAQYMNRNNIMPYFFDLGDLHEGLPIVAGYTYQEGSESEKQKFNEIHFLYNLIIEYEALSFISEKLKNLKKVSFLLTNCDSKVCEDIDVTLTLNYDEIVHLKELFFIPDSEEAKDFILKDNILEKLFITPAGFNYASYSNDDSIISNPIFKSEQFDIGKILKIKDRMNSIFCYEVNYSQNLIQIRFHVDKLKNSNSISFPTPIVFLNSTQSVIHYKINFANCGKDIEGKITIN